MTEREWLEGTAPIPMLEFLGGKASARKQRLYRCACCREVWPLLSAAASRDAVEIAERFADGLAGAAELKDGFIAAWRVVRQRRVGLGHAMWAARVAASSAAPAMATAGSTSAAWEISQAAAEEAKAAASARQAGLLRDVVGSPFRPTTVRPEWLTPDVLSLAHAAYDERALPSGRLDPVRLGILSDALEEAGGEAPILEHLRSPGPHVRGCHVLDRLLGRE